MMDIVRRLRKDRLMNPDYPTRIDAADEIERLRRALEDVVAVLDSPEVQGVWAFYAVHGQKYSGPWADMNKARAALNPQPAKEDC